MALLSRLRQYLPLAAMPVTAQNQALAKNVFRQTRLWKLLSTLGQGRAIKNLLLVKHKLFNVIITRLALFLIKSSFKLNTDQFHLYDFL